jgi:hypothetical protein
VISAALVEHMDVSEQHRGIGEETENPEEERGLRAAGDGDLAFDRLSVG